MSITQVLSATALARAYRELNDHVQALEAHVKSDYEAIKADLEARVAHYRAEAARLEGIVGTAIADLLKKGHAPATAVDLVEQITNQAEGK